MGKRLSTLGLIFLIASACHKEYGPQSLNGGTVVPDSTAVIIVNEGNFQWGNASIGQYNPDRKQYQDGLYREANGSPLGDVIQEAHRIHDRYYLVMNGSNELVICDLDWTKISSTPGISAPKQLVYWRGSLWMSDLYSRKLRQYDLDGKFLQEIGLGFPNANLFIWQDELHCYHQGHWKYLESPIASPKRTSYPPGDIDQITRVADGIIIGFENGNSYFFDADNQVINLDLFRLPLSTRVADDANDRFFSYDGDSLFVHRAQADYTREFLLAISCENFYGLSYFGPTGSLFLFDAQSFVQPHRVRRINASSGLIEDDFEAGALPNGLVRVWE